MENVKNVAIGKFGQSVKFDPSKFGAIGGDNEAPDLFLAVARKNPDINFYMIGKSDLRLLKPEVKEKLNIPSNIIDAWEGFSAKKHDTTTYVYDRLKELGIKIDCGVFYNGQNSSSNIPQFLKKANGDFYSPLCVFSNYVGPIIYFLNQTGIKYFTLAPDPRYVPLGARDLMNRESFALSLHECSRQVKYVKSFEDQSLLEKDIPLNYSGVEKVILLETDARNKQFGDPKTMPKTTKMFIILNEGGNGGIKRGPALKEYILDQFPDVEVVGKWSEEWLKDPRFKGPVKFLELPPLLNNVKYTFMISVEKGWLSAKFWEMISYDIIPFMHPDYDCQHHLPAPDFIRIKSPEDLKEKIEFLENNPDEYKKLLEELRAVITPEDLDGTSMNDMIMEGIKKL
jgi:hypothetical protein